MVRVPWIEEVDCTRPNDPDATAILLSLKRHQVSSLTRAYAPDHDLIGKCLALVWRLLATCSARVLHVFLPRTETSSRLDNARI
jgi:hypothetical protein